MADSGSSPLFDRFRAETNSLHRLTINHKTVSGIGSGSLSEETFRYYLEQDFQFLLRFVRVLAVAASSAPDLESMGQLSKLVASTVDVEIDALRDLYQRFGGNPDHLECVRLSPTCEAYCNHLLATVHERDLLLSLAAVLPCHWGYHDIGLHLKSAGLPDDERYAAWIEEYASVEYGELVNWAIDRFNRSGEDASSTRLKVAFRAFDLSSRYELAFWEMAWLQEQWPIVAT